MMGHVFRAPALRAQTRAQPTHGVRLPGGRTSGKRVSCWSHPDPLTIEPQEKGSPQDPPSPAHRKKKPFEKGEPQGVTPVYPDQQRPAPGGDPGSVPLARWARG